MPSKPAGFADMIPTFFGQRQATAADDALSWGLSSSRERGHIIAALCKDGWVRVWTMREERDAKPAFHTQIRYMDAEISDGVVHVVLLDENEDITEDGDTPQV
jgi:hypothetical protein